MLTTAGPCSVLGSHGLAILPLLELDTGDVPLGRGVLDTTDNTIHVKSVYLDLEHSNLLLEEL